MDKNIQRAAQQLLDSTNNIEEAMQALRAVKDSKPATKHKKISTRPVLVEVSHMSKHYKVGKQRITALEDVSVTIHEGEFVAFTGPSGSGKSTLLQAIGGLDKPTGGSIIVDGQDITHLRDAKLSAFRNQTIGFVFQFFYLQPFLQLQTNLEVPAMFARTKRKQRRERVASLATAVGIEDRLHHLPKELSGGQMQRAAIARALLNHPKVLLADEPTGNLDSKNSAAIIDLFEEIRRLYGTTIIVVTHDPKIADRADREIVLNDGRIVA